MVGNQIRIALSGKARVGKDTVAKLIIQHLKLDRYEYKIRAFADPMKEIIKIMFPNANDECLYGASELRGEIISDQFLNRDFHRKSLTYRNALTDIGRYAREYNENIWVSNLDYNLNNPFNKRKTAYIVSDCRFVNEFNYLRDNGFYLIRVLRKDIDRGFDVSEVEQEQISDESLDKVIYNDYSIEVLSEEVKQLVDKLRIK